MNNREVRSFILFTLILSVLIYSLFDSDEPIEQLNKNFYNCEYEKAIKYAEIILNNPNLNKKDKSQIYIIKGVSEFSSHQVLNAKITFVELIFFDNNVTLDSMEVSPKIIEFFNQLKNTIEVNSI